jgi:hypothetical protein
VAVFDVMANWKTNTVGIVMIAAAAALAISPAFAGRFHSMATDLVLLGGGIGHILAKDGDK